MKLCPHPRAHVLVCAVKFVNSFARRQHLFVIAAKPIDVEYSVVVCSLALVPISPKM